MLNFRKINGGEIELHIIHGYISNAGSGYFYNDSFDHFPFYFICGFYHWSVNSIMPKHNEYFIVEFRMPIKIDSVSSVQEAVSMASQVIQNQYGFKPENWIARIFQYSTDSNVPGYVKEFFYNPNSSSFREITKNIGYHNDLIKTGNVPEGVDNDKQENDN